MSFIKLTDLDLAGKRVLIRADLNVPVKDGKVTSDARITASMPTIEHCMKAGGVDDDISLDVAPFQVGRITLCSQADFLAINNDRVNFG